MPSLPQPQNLPRLETGQQYAELHIPGLGYHAHLLNQQTSI